MWVGRPVLPNSSFAVNETGVIRRKWDPREFLSTDERRVIARDAMSLYRRVVDIVENERVGLR
jgi:hypothetical protein